MAAELSFDVGRPAYDLCAHWGSPGSGLWLAASPVFLFLFRALFRRLWLAAAALVLLAIAVFSPTNLPDLCAGAVFAVVITFILIRFGVMALMAAIFVWQVLLFFPLTTDLTTWYASSSLFAIASVLALTAYAGYTALAGRPLFQAGFLESD